MKAGGAKNNAHTDESRLGRDLLGLFSIFFSILIILSLASFDSRDPWLNHVVGGSQNIRNKTGLFGAYTAGFLYDVFGAAAWVLPAFLSSAGARRILGTAPWPWRRWSGFLFSALCIGIAGAAGDLGNIGLFARDALPAGSGNVSSHGGGLIGHMLYVWLMGWLGPTGAFLVWLFTLLSSVQLLSGLSLPLLAFSACVALKQRIAGTLRTVASGRGAAPMGVGRQTGNACSGGTEIMVHHTAEAPALSPPVSAPERDNSAETTYAQGSDYNRIPAPGRDNNTAQEVAAQAGGLSPGPYSPVRSVPIHIRHRPQDDAASADGNRPAFSHDQSVLPEYVGQEEHPASRDSFAGQASPVRDDAPGYRPASDPACPCEDERDAHLNRGQDGKSDEYWDRTPDGRLPELQPPAANGNLEEDEDIPPWVHDFENDRLGPPPFSSVFTGRARAFDGREHEGMRVSAPASADVVPTTERPVDLGRTDGRNKTESSTFDLSDHFQRGEDFPASDPTEGVPATEHPEAHGGPTGGANEISRLTFEFPDLAHRGDDFSAPDPAGDVPAAAYSEEFGAPGGGREKIASITFDSPDHVQHKDVFPDPAVYTRAEFDPEGEENTVGPVPRSDVSSRYPNVSPPAASSLYADVPRTGQALPTKIVPAGAASSRPDLDAREVSLPPLDILEAAASPSCGIQRDVLERKGRDLMNCLHDFGIQGELAAITPGPVVTMFEIKPAPGVRVARIAGLSDDLALALKAAAVRIQAPVPGTDSVGIEIPNTTRETVCLKELLSSSVFRQSPSLLTLALGKDTAGNPVTADLASMPHLLVAGATGAGKSVGINSIILSILYKARPDQVKLLLVDPKRVEMSIYSDLPHLVHPVVTEMPMAKSALEWAVSEMEHRYDVIAGAGVRNITDYNARIASWEKNPPPGMEDVMPIPFLVLIIDELADLMLVASKEVETSIVRLAQLARAAGIHLILATQRPSVDVVTGLIKANFPCRISFQVTSKHDSRTILDTVGAEHLLGKGDMLFKPAGGKFRRLHGAFVSDRNVNAVADYWKALRLPDYTIDFADWGQEGGSGPAAPGGSVMDINAEPLYNEAVVFVRSQGKASISLIQRKFRIGFNKAARYVEQMEADGIIGPADGSKPRPVIK